MKPFTEISSEIDLYEMTGVAPKTSGLGVHIWISSRSKAKHGPRIKVSDSIGKFDPTDNFSMSVSHDPEIVAGTPRIHHGHLETLKDWIIMNHTHLHRIWHSDVLDSQDHLDGIIKM